MTAQDALKVVLRDVVGPYLRTAGFKGSGRTWKRANAAGDIAVVNVQSSAFSSADTAPCVINIALVPEPWRDWLTTRDGTTNRSVGYTSGVYRGRLHPTGTPSDQDHWWKLTGAADADTVAHDMITQLQERGLPLLIDLLDRTRLLDAISAGDRGVFVRARTPGFAGQVEAALLADLGPSRRLDELLASIEHQADTAQTDHARAFGAWARARADGLKDAAS